MLAQLPPALQSLHLPLRLKLWDGNQFDLGPSPQVTILVKEPQLISQLTHPSMDQLGTAFVEGKLELEGDIGEAIRVCDELSEALLADEDETPPQRLSHDKSTDAKAISYHYDVSNAFYQLWLDQDMAYSCAYFREPDNTLDQAQQDKFDHLCRKLRLDAGDYLLDVGCGWGGLARFAAREYGAKVFGITLSKEQLKLGRKRVQAEGLADKVDLQIQVAGPVAQKQIQQINAMVQAGAKAIIEGQHWGLIHKNEVFKFLRSGMREKGFIKELRADGKISLSLQPVGQEAANSLHEKILQQLQANGELHAQYYLIGVMEGALEAGGIGARGVSVIEVGDRAEAILRGVDALTPGDALLIAGKGHETGQIIGTDVYPFDDVEQASVAVAALDGRI